MDSFIFDYGLFAAKFLTIAVAVTFFIILIGALRQAKLKHKDSIEVEKINEHFDELKEVMEAGIYDKKTLKYLKKKLKKAVKDKAQESHDEPGKIFVLSFYGDTEASEVEHLRELITAILLVANPGKDRVLAKIESSGGLVHSYGFAAAQLKRLRDAKLELVVSVDLIAASGGYMMACVADSIIAAPFAVLGSIGVLAQIPNFNRALERLNIDVEQHTAGEYKTTLTMLGKNTDKDRQKFREELDDAHKLFKDFVHEMRPQMDIESIATGECWYGSQAEANKLIDAVMTSDDYLMKHKDSHEIFSVEYVIHESIKDKIHDILQMSRIKLGNLFSTIKKESIKKAELPY